MRILNKKEGKWWLIVLWLRSRVRYIFSLKAKGEWTDFWNIIYYSDFLFNPDIRSTGACRVRNRQGKRTLYTFPFISFLGKLSCVDGIQSFLVNEYQDKCMGLWTRTGSHASMTPYLRAYMLHLEELIYTSPIDSFQLTIVPPTLYTFYRILQWRKCPDWMSLTRNCFQPESCLAARTSSYSVDCNDNCLKVLVLDLK